MSLCLKTKRTHFTAQSVNAWNCSLCLHFSCIKIFKRIAPDYNQVKLSTGQGSQLIFQVPCNDCLEKHKLALQAHDSWVQKTE